MEQEFKEWLLQQQTQQGNLFSETQTNNLCKDLRETIPGWVEVDYENLFNVDDITLIDSLYQRCLKDGDLKKLCKGVGNNRPSNALIRYKEFLKQRNNKPQCTWVPFFNELSEKLVNKNPQELSNLLTKTFEEFKKDNNIPEQIDPFSFFAKIVSVGSHYKSDNPKDKRRIALIFLKDELGIRSELPKDYDGVPTSDARNVFLFPVNNKDYEQDVLLLCKLFKQSQENSIEDITFNEALDIKQVAFTKLTQALFWSNANNHFPVDSVTTPYFGLNKNPKNYQDYLEILEKIKQKNKSHCLLSYEAWSHNEQDETMTDEKLQGIIDLLQSKQQIILQGPPGTGKTRMAKIIAKKIIGESEDSQKLIQFHPAYSYEDFVRGIVATTTDGKVGYEVQNKVLAEIAEDANTEYKLAKAKEERKPKKFVLIIDEINRANLSAVLGELIYALEYRGEAVESMYAKDGNRKIVLPKNLYIIGTMNTADRSVGYIDYAIRRRFAFVDVPTKRSVIEKKYPNNLALFDKVKTLFGDNLSDEFDENDVMIGHSYFLNDNLKLALEYEIKPILREYVKDGILTCKKDEINKLKYQND